MLLKEISPPVQVRVQEVLFLSYHRLKEMEHLFCFIHKDEGQRKDGTKRYVETAICAIMIKEKHPAGQGLSVPSPAPLNREV
jgi:hypothetical protein